MIRAVLFDVFETLITEHGLAVPRASSLGPRLGLQDRPFRVAWRERRPAIVRGRLSFAEALLEIGRQLGVEIDSAAVRRVSDERVRAKTAVFDRVDPDVLELTRELSRKGIRLAAVSNCFAEDVAAWPTCALAPQFTSTVFSFAVGTAKPEAEIYLEAVKQLGVAPAEALFVGDGADDELCGAEQAGLRPVRAAWFVDTPPVARVSVPCAFHHRELLNLGISDEGLAIRDDASDAPRSRA